MRRLVVLIWLCGAVLTTGMVAGQTPAAAKPSALPALPAVDLADLDLRVVEGRPVDSIPLGKAPLKAQKDMKLVVVSLRGKLPAAGQVTASAAAFFAYYATTSEQPIPGTPGLTAHQERVDRTQAKAVDLGNEGDWGPTATQSYPKPKDVLLEVVTEVPAGITEFSLIYDTAKGKQRARVKLAQQPERKLP